MRGVTYREATLDDAELATDLMTATYPALGHDPVITRLRWQNLREGFAAGRFIAELHRSPVAFLAWLHGPWDEVPDRHCEVEVWLDRAEMDRTVLRSMWSWLEPHALAEGSQVLLAYAAEDETEALEVLADLGYKKERVERVWELDLRVHGSRLIEEAAAASAAMSALEVRLITLADWDDPDRESRLHQLDARTRQDVPHSLTIVPETLSDFRKRMRSPDRPYDRFWVALRGSELVAMSYLRFPPVRGPVWTGFTCTHPDHRGRGIARAVKLQTLAQAARLGVPTVQTDNDSENAPMLRINEKLGYRPRPGFVEHHKRVTN
ncbi:MAG TPA: GNAT family N-acetyltransferase [Candidatus Dormibacteraeota bacterium]|nr:GNAT family N-acetyltransferase [Candidatus Dormibacteraeota bacterium]